MIESAKTRVGIIIAVLIIAGITFYPNIKDVGDGWWFSKQKLSYGLDIQGGIHLVMGVDIDGVIREATNRLVKTVEAQFQKDGIGVKSIKMIGSKDENDKYRIAVEWNQPSDASRMRESVTKNFPNLQILDENASGITLRYYDTYYKDLSKRTLEQAIETLRNRIDEFGVAEPSITAQGEDRILVQLPGIQDASRAKDLINRTAHLEFQMVADPVPELGGWITEAEKAGGYDLTKMSYSEYFKRINEDLAKKLPANTKVYFSKDENAETLATGKVPHLLRLDTNLSGDSLNDARIAYNQFNEPIVSLSFNPAGAARFADLTGANINKQMAIVLDNIVFSAPVINGRIPNGTAEITMGGSRDYQKSINEAKNIATALRAGALPAALEQLEERTVGPSLGLDSINNGKKAAAIAGILVVVFMIVFYSVGGLIADIALALNIFLTLCLLTALGATLTLPGIAGIALTMGMAVDSNIIIFERIKEELRKGASWRQSLEIGYDKAFHAILDSNITSIMVCIVLMYFGTGPVRGFAVTLIIGIVTSMFTAVFVSKTIMEYFVLGKTAKHIPLGWGKQQ